MAYDEFEDEFEDFEDEFGDEPLDEFDDDGDLAGSFGPTYVQAETSIGFEDFAMAAGFGVVLISIWLLWSSVYTPVYDSIGMVDTDQYDGLGRRLPGVDEGMERISFAPPSVPVLGFGRYDLGSDGDYDYAVLDAGADNGLDIGLIYYLPGEGDEPAGRIIITAVEAETARAEFIEFGVDPTDNEAVKASLETLKMDRTWTDPTGQITHARQPSVWEIETVRQLVWLLGPDSAARGVSAEDTRAAMDYFAALGVPGRNRVGIFAVHETDENAWQARRVGGRAESSDEVLRRVQIAVYNELAALQPEEAARRLMDAAVAGNLIEAVQRDGNYDRFDPASYRPDRCDIVTYDVNGQQKELALPKQVAMPRPARMSPVLREELVAEALDLPGAARLAALPEQFPDLNPEWNVISLAGSDSSDLPADDLISRSGTGDDGRERFTFGRPVSGVTASLAPADEQLVLRMVLDKMIEAGADD